MLFLGEVSTFRITVGGRTIKRVISQSKEKGGSLVGFYNGNIIDHTARRAVSRELPLDSSRGLRERNPCFLDEKKRN